LVSKLQGLTEGESLRLERVFRLTGRKRLDRLPQVFGWAIIHHGLFDESLHLTKSPLRGSS